MTRDRGGAWLAGGRARRRPTSIGLPDETMRAHAHGTRRTGLVWHPINEAATTGLSGRIARMANAGRSRRDAMGLAFLLLAVLAAFAPGWLRGQVFFELDTLKQYAPYIEYAATSLRAGTLPLWNPYVFTGFPQFADGHTGVLHPLHIPFLLAGAHEALLVWGPVIRAMLAATAAYALARTLRVSPAGATLTGLSFGLGSFVVAQQHHLDIANAAPVLPALLAAWERAFGAPSARGRMAWFGVAGLVFSTALLAIQPQLVLITAFGAALYVVGSLAVGRRHVANGGGRLAGALGWTAVGGFVIALIAGGLSAIQTVPLMELIANSARGTALPPSEAARFATPPLASVQLLFPAIFGRGASYWFSWNQWETAFYAGAVPLAFGLLALRRPTRLVLTIALAGVMSALIAQAEQGALPLFELVNDIPGFDRARAPARFVLIAGLMIALLAGIGLDRAGRLRMVRPAMAVGALAAAGIAALAAVHFWLDSGQGAAPAVERWLASLPELASVPHGSSRIDLVVGTTRPWSVANLLPPASALAALAIFVAAARRDSLRPLVGPSVALLAAVELSYFAATFHPSAPVADLLDETVFEPVAAVGQVYPRIYVSEAIDLGSNRLLPARVAEATGYTPLAPTRIALLLEAWHDNPRRIARVLGVSRAVYRSHPRRGFERWTVEGTEVTFSLNRPAFAVDQWSPESDGWIELPPGMAVRRILLVASLDGGTDDAQGTPVASLEWLRDDMVLAERPLRAGIELAERTGFGAARHREPAHGNAEVAAYVGEDRSSIYTLIRAQFPGSGDPNGVRIRVRLPDRRVTVHGVSVIDAEGTLWRQWAPLLESRSSPEEILVSSFEAGPRVFLNDRVQLVDDERQALERLAQSVWEYPRRSVIEAGAWGPSIDTSMFGNLTGSDTSGARAELVDHAPTHLTIRTSARRTMMLIVRDAYYPGWKASVDGTETAVLAADVAGRAVQVPAGEHLVEMRYDPASFKLGAAVSAASALGVVSYFVGLAAWPRLTATLRGLSRRRRPGAIKQAH